MIRYFFAVMVTGIFMHLTSLLVNEKYEVGLKLIGFTLNALGTALLIAAPRER